MKTFLTAVITSICTAALTTLLVQHRQMPNLVMVPQVLTLHELRIVDDAGVVRARLGMEGAGRGGQNPALELFPMGGGRSGVSLQLNREGLGTLYFSSPDTDGKVIVGHYWGCDSSPASDEEHCGAWGLNILNLQPKDGDTPKISLMVGSNGTFYPPQLKR